MIKNQNFNVKSILNFPTIFHKNKINKRKRNEIFRVFLNFPDQ